MDTKIENYIIIVSLTSETMGKLINRIPGLCLLISSLPGSALRLHVESSTSLPGRGRGTCSLVPCTEISLWHISKNINFSVNYCLQKNTFPEVCFNRKQSVSSVDVKILNLSHVFDYTQIILMTSVE